MKTLTLITFLLISTVAIAQKKVVPKTAKPIAKVVKPAKVADSTKVRMQAEKYFKDVYVVQTFKDPYSYKLLKCSVIPINSEQDLKDSLSLNNEVLTVADTAKSFNYQAGKIAYLHFTKLAIDEEKLKGKGDMYEPYIREANKNKKKIDSCINEYTTAIKKKAHVEEALNSLSESERKTIIYYRVYIDSHGNNSYGGAVLGRYEFPYKLDTGVLREPIKYN